MTGLDAAARREFRATIRPEWWPRISISPTTGCFRAVLGARSGVQARYPSVNGRLMHRLVWEDQFGPTGSLLVRLCGDPLCVRITHTLPMDWKQCHTFHRQRRSQAAPEASPGLPGVTPPIHPSRAAQAVQARITASASETDPGTGSSDREGVHQPKEARHGQQPV